MSSRYENVKNSIFEMFEQRGYTNMKQVGEQLVANKRDSNKICAFLKIIDKLNVAEIHNHISILQKDEINHGLIVYEGIPTPAVKNVISTICDLKINIELFQAEDLQYNVTKHILVPEHTVLNKEQTKEFKSKFGTDIPILLKSDPISRFYNFSKGDIVKITRKNGFISYRIVR